MAADQIYVRPAREGILVPFAPHRPGQFIGVRHVQPDDAPESIVARAEGGHAYVTSDAYIQRRIQQGDLIEVEMQSPDAPATESETPTTAETPRARRKAGGEEPKQ
jgi:hypothetical protein